MGVYYKQWDDEKQFFKVVLSGVRLAVRINAASDTSNFYWFHLDHLGGTHKVTRGNGEVATTYLYDAWGGLYYDQGQGTVTDRLYTGQTRLEEDLYYYGARWYDPSLGRFLQADTILPVQQGTQGWDRYAYVNNNPVINIDPNGQSAFSTMETDNGGSNMADIVSSNYDWKIIDESEWDQSDILTLFLTGYEMNQTIGGGSSLKNLMGKIEWDIRILDNPSAIAVTWGEASISLNKDQSLSRWTIAHELGHALNFSTNGLLEAGIEYMSGGKTDLLRRLDLTTCNSLEPGCNKAGVNI